MDKKKMKEHMTSVPGAKKKKIRHSKKQISLEILAPSFSLFKAKESYFDTEEVQSKIRGYLDLLII